MLLSVLLVAVVAASSWALTYCAGPLAVENSVVLGWRSPADSRSACSRVVGMNTAVAVGALLPALWAVVGVVGGAASRLASGAAACAFPCAGRQPARW
jgi:hypothetical protein